MVTYLETTRNIALFHLSRPYTVQYQRMTERKASATSSYYQPLSHTSSTPAPSQSSSDMTDMVDI